MRNWRLDPGALQGFAHTKREVAFAEYLGAFELPVIQGCSARVQDWAAEAV